MFMRYNWFRKPLRKICPDCGRRYAAWWSSVSCNGCSFIRFRRLIAIRSKVGTEMVKAYKSGELKRIGKLDKCVDCGKPAKHYDHRDYSKPLDVVPVCVSCNILRGPAIQTKNIVRLDRSVRPNLYREQRMRSYSKRRVVIESSNDRQG